MMLWWEFVALLVVAIVVGCYLVGRQDYEENGKPNFWYGDDDAHELDDDDL